MNRGSFNTRTGNNDSCHEIETIKKVTKKDDLMRNYVKEKA